MNKNEICDKLQTEVTKLLRLLEDRQFGLFTWNEFFFQQINEIKKIIKEHLE